MQTANAVETIVYDGVTFALLIRKEISLKNTRFFGEASYPLQVGFVAHDAGYIEPAHKHKEVHRDIRQLHQMVYIEKGAMAVDFYRDDKTILGSVDLRPGDMILLMDGAHSIRVTEEVRAISVKQGPFLGDAEDKVNL